MDFAKLRHIIFFGFLVAVTAIFLYMIRPFAYPIFWAAIIAGIFHPVYKFIIKHLKNANLSSTLTLIIVFIVIIIPLTLIASLVVAESVQFYGTIDNNSQKIGEVVQNTTNWIRYNPYTTQLHVDKQFWTEKISQGSQMIAEFVFNAAKAITQNSLIFLVKFVLMFYTLFFFVRDGEKMLKFIMHLCPLGDKYEKLLYKKFTSTASATMKGTLIVGGIQGALGAILFWLTGMEGFLIWGIIMAAASIIPPFGTGIIWLPIGIFMLLTGDIWQGVIILATGFLVISTIDNLIRPILIGKDTAMHPIIVLFSTLGGLLIFGVSGLVIGPVIAALFMAFWEMYDHYYQNQLCKNNEDGI